MRLMGCAAMRVSTSRSQANGSMPFSLQVSIRLLDAGRPVAAGIRTGEEPIPAESYPAHVFSARLLSGMYGPTTASSASEPACRKIPPPDKAAVTGWIRVGSILAHSFPGASSPAT